MELSKRLCAVAALVTPGNRLADVGTDHAYLPIYLVKNEQIPGAIAMDVNRGPLQRAVEHIQEEGLSDYIETRLSDGLQKLNLGEADTVVIAGMGGALTIRLLEQAAEVLRTVKELILQPQSEISRVRLWLEEHGFQIADEDIVLEDGKYYPMMRVVHGEMHLAGEEEALYGPVLLKQKSPCLLQYLRWEEAIKENVLKQLKQARGENAKQRREEVMRALCCNRLAQKRFGSGSERHIDL